MTAIKKLVNFCIETPPLPAQYRGEQHSHYSIMGKWYAIIDKVSLNDIILVEVVNFCN